MQKIVVSKHAKNRLQERFKFHSFSTLLPKKDLVLTSSKTSYYYHFNHGKKYGVVVLKNEKGVLVIATVHTTDYIDKRNPKVLKKYWLVE